MSEDNAETIYIKELNPDIIAPSTKQLGEAESWGGSKLIICGKPGCFVKDTKILMFDGTMKNVQDVNVGDVVMGDDSTPRNVIETCHNSDEMFKVIPNKGEPYTVNKQHKLVLKSSGFNRYNKSEIVEITVENYLKETTTFKNRMKIFRNSVEFPEQKISIDPYLLGLWLGDGTKSNSEFTNMDVEVIQYLQEYCDKNNMVFGKKSENSEMQYRLSSHEKTKGKNQLINSFREYNLLNNKHIPHEYKANSRNVRLELLAGILDTDGSYDDNSLGYDFVQKNEQLFDDVIFIARSLGLSANKKQVTKSCTYKDKKIEGTYYRCFISGNIDEIPCKIKRKIARERIAIKDHLVSGFILESQGEGEYFGFTLDGNHRFLLGTCDVVRNTGKSTLIASLLYAKKHIFPVAVAFSGSEDSNGFYRKILPSTFVFNEYNEDQIKSFIRRQKIAKQHLPNPWAVILLDDCTDDSRVFNTPLQQGMYKRGRHWSMLYIVSLQYAMDVKPVIRTNVDGVFILREPILKNRRSLWENYASVVPDFNIFCQLLDQLTDDFCCIYISNQTKTNDWKECVFWYKASPIPEDWKFGCPEYRQFHDDRFNPEYVDPFD